MIIHDKKLIFVHIPRTGGSSIETVFGQPIEMTQSPDLIIKEVGEDVWRNYFKFSIVRNPFDRIVSWYHYFNLPEKRSFNWVKPGENFKDWVVRRHKTISLPPWQQYNRIKNLDKVIRFENYATDVPNFLKQYGVTKAIPHINKSEGRLPYQDYYDTDTRNIIADEYKIDLDNLGYEF